MEDAAGRVFARSAKVESGSWANKGHPNYGAVGFQLYAQAFNVLNHIAWADPSLNLQDPADFGALESQYNGLGLGGHGASANFTRNIQLGVRVHF
jgi:hypothetical protein